MKRLIVLTAVLAMTVLALPSYTGYSGAPGSSGECAANCHGSSGGTITVTGFPASYTLGQAYTVTIGHDGGSRIANFNGSVRVGTGSQTAGTIAAGSNTSTYSESGEPNGVHFTSSNQDDGTFTWTAPATGVGPVRLYVSGLQGTSMNGPNSALVLVANQGAGIEAPGQMPPKQVAFRVEPTLVTRTLTFTAMLPAGASGTVMVVNRAGRVVSRLSVAAGDGTSQSVRWSPEARGRRLPAGDYVAALVSDGELLAVRFTVVR